MPDKRSPPINVFTLIVFQEVDIIDSQEKFIGERIRVDKQQSIGIMQYELSVADANLQYDRLIAGKGWDDVLQKTTLQAISKQYTPSNEEAPLNRALKNNFDGGSYILEFFDEEKKLVASLLDYKKRENFDNLCQEIRQQIPINLAGLRDRIGNIIFQFPVTIADITSQALSAWTGVHLNFTWHKLLPTPPDCLIQVDALLDGNLMGHTTIDYNKQKTQTVDIRNLEGETYIRIERMSPSLILATFKGHFIREFSLNMSVINHEPRLFEIDGKIEKVQVNSPDNRGIRKQEKKYTDHIQSRLYESDLTALRTKLSFKQYGQSTTHEEGLKDIRDLIHRNEKTSVYLWDPFLSAKDLLQTLYFSQIAGIPLRAITALNTVKEEETEAQKLTKQQLINTYRSLLQNPANNNFGLNLEFRCRINQHGWAFHDRFLIFPGDNDNRAAAYSLGTSVNSFGKEHHILQEVSHPQRIADAFEELWNKLDHVDCVIWKSR